ncbi:MAG: phosphomannomutase/phosphoglucomutase [Proteobacteria bacterium]|nr:phosphomannomutase/phosphoglucomutase [Pseudomonadota bacterium]
MKVNEAIFREYDIRGIADSDLTDGTAVLLGKAIGTFVRKKGGQSFSVGRDCRLSGPRIRKALIDGLVSTGLNVVDIGLVPTPLLYFSVFHLNTDGGVQITGSHNPPEHNGLKVCVGKTTLHGEEIQELKELVRSQAFAQGRGTISEADIKKDYAQHIFRTVKPPFPLKVVVDSGNGTAGVIAPELFRRLGCEVIELFSEPDGNFPNHPPDPTVPESQKVLISEVQRHKAHVGIGFDGDADRVAVVDPSGKALFGDELLVLYARRLLKDHPGATVISEVKASHRLFQDIAQHGGKPILWKTGHSLIKAKMKETGALLAGEMSGHMFFKDRYFGFDDAIYAAVRLFEILSEEKKTAFELLRDLPPSFCTPEIRMECSDDKKFEVVSRAKKQFEGKGYRVNSIDGARVEFKDGWGLVRASNTQAVLVLRFEATSAERLQEIRTDIETTVHQIISAL